MNLSESGARALGRLASTADRLRQGREVLRRQVIEARGAGVSWESIGRMIGCTGEAARQKYGPRVERARVQAAEALF